MNVHWLVLFLVIGAAMTVPAVSAKIVEEKNGYLVTTVDDSIRLPEMARFASSSISQGQTQWYSTYVPSGKTSFYTDLFWGNPSNSLELTISAPGATFGPYYDSADGMSDGRIYLRIYRYGGLATGTWGSGVYGYRVTGTQSYSYSASAS
jgi:hypothetical protein